MKSINFDFLRIYHEQLFQLGYFAERFFSDDPNTSLIKSRQLAEFIAKETAARTANYKQRDREPLSDLLRRLRNERIVPTDVLEIIHTIRRNGNAAAHEFTGTHADALTSLKLGRALAIWFHRTFGGDTSFSPGPFVPPRSPGDETSQLHEELERLKKEVRRAEGDARPQAENSEEHQNEPHRVFRRPFRLSHAAMAGSSSMA